MTAKQIIEINKIRVNYFWQGMEFDWSGTSTEVRQFVENNEREMNSTKDLFHWVKKNFGIELTPFQIFEINCGGIVSDDAKSQYQKIYGDTKSVFDL